jgi:hypothetical protein
LGEQDRPSDMQGLKRSEVNREADLRKTTNYEARAQLLEENIRLREQIAELRCQLKMRMQQVEQRIAAFERARCEAKR